MLGSNKYFVGRRVCVSDKYFVFKLVFVGRAKNSKYMNTLCSNVRVRQTCFAKLQFRSIVSEVIFGFRYVERQINLLIDRPLQQPLLHITE